MKTIYSFLIRVICILPFFAIAQSNSFTNKAQKLLGTFSIYHFRPISLNETTAAEVVELFVTELDKQGFVLKQTDVNLLNIEKGQLFNQINSSNETYLKNAQKIYSKALATLDSMLTVISAKKLDFTQNDTAHFFANTLKTNYSLNIKTHYKRLEKNIKNRCYERVTNTDGYEKLTEQEFNNKAVDFSKTIIANFQNNIKQLIKQADNDVESTLLNALALRHDPHSNYFTQEQNQDFSKSLSSKIESFGFYLDEDEDGNIVVSYLEPGGSAWISNDVNVGDFFISMKIGTDLYTNEGSSAYQLQEKMDNSVENAIILSLKKQNGQLKVVKLIKQKMTSLENSVKGYVLKGKDGNVGYISLPSFYTDMENSSLPGCANDVAKEILKLEEDTISGLILDLRNNGGGSMQEAMNLAGIFVDEGPLFIFKEKTKKPYLMKDQNRGSLFKKPLVVMINEISASASELFSNIVKDYNIGLVVGQTSYGKGTAQNVIPLDTNVLRMKNGLESTKDFIKITNGKFYRLNCSTHQGVGVVPDVVMPFTPGFSIYKESKEAYFIEPDLITKNVVYTPNKVIQVESIKQKSAQRTASSKDFIRYKQSADSLIDFIEKPQEIILKFNEFKKYKQFSDKLYNSFGNAYESSSDEIKCLNNTFDKKIVELNEQTKEFNSKVRDAIMKDIFIKEAFYILNDLKEISK